jgi:hypothetical protein
LDQADVSDQIRIDEGSLTPMPQAAISANDIRLVNVTDHAAIEEALRRIQLLVDVSDRDTLRPLLVKTMLSSGQIADAIAVADQIEIHDEAIDSLILILKAQRTTQRGETPTQTISRIRSRLSSLPPHQKPEMHLEAAIAFHETGFAELAQAHVQTARRSAEALLASGQRSGGSVALRCLAVIPRYEREFFETH